MNETKYKTLSLPLKIRKLFDEFVFVREESGISLLDFFKRRGIIYDPHFTTKLDEDKKILEEFRASSSPRSTLIWTIVCGLGLILGVGFISFRFMNPDSDWTYLVFAMGFFGGIGIIVFGLRQALTRIIIYTDKLVFMRPLSTRRISWREIVKVDIRKKEIVTKQKRMIIGYKEINRRDAGFILDIYLPNEVKSLDLETYGMESGSILLKKLFEYMILLAPQAKIPGLIDREETNNLISKAFQMMNKDIGMAFELGLDALIADDKNPFVWKLIAIILVSIMPDESFLFLDVALELNPKDPDLWNSRGLAYEQLDSNEKAIEAFQYAYSIQPTHSFARNNLQRHGIEVESLKKLEIVD